MSPKIANIILWIGRILMAGVFVSAGVQKLSGSPMMVHEFDVIGFGQWFRYLTAAMEVGGGLLLLWPRNSFYGALTLLCVDGGAFLAQLLILHGDVIHTFVIGAILVSLAWYQRPGSAHHEQHRPTVAI